jgi:hypothetical protein
VANPTSNFGWQMPTPVDLVTDLPADFEVFGQAVDSSLADLKGGTSGQVLAKNSNTDMDFVWVTSDDANAIQNSIINAKGDLITGTANDTPAVLSVGANDLLVTAASGEATGLKYTGGWAAYTPTFSNFTLGNGTVNARFCKIGKVVFVYALITVGSTTSISSFPIISLPVNAATTGYFTGTSDLQDVGNTNYMGKMYIDNATGAFISVDAVGGSYANYAPVSATVPFTWVSGDRMLLNFYYEGV